MLKDLSCKTDDDKECIVAFPMELTYTRNEVGGVYATGIVSSSHKAVDVLNDTLQLHQEYITDGITFRLSDCNQFPPPPPPPPPPHSHDLHILVTLIVGVMIILMVLILPAVYIVHW